MHRMCKIIHTDFKPENVVICLKDSEVAEIAKKVILVGFMAIVIPGSTEQLVIGFSFTEMDTAGTGCACIAVDSL